MSDAQTQPKDTKVLLVTPDYHCGVVEAAGKWPHLGFVYVAGELRAHGYDVRIYDAMAKGVRLEEIRAEIEAFGPHIVASTAYTSTLYAAIDVLRAAKEWATSAGRPVITLLGGVHPTFMWEEVLRDYSDVLDFVVRYEGEETTAELLDALLEVGVLETGVADAMEGTVLDGVRGIAYLRDGRPHATPERPYRPNLDTLTPAWDLLDWDDYKFYAKPGARLAIVSSSRGCSEKCAFCSQQKFWKQTWRARSPESFVTELQILHETYGVSIFFVADEYPTCERERWRDILERVIAKELPIWLLIETRVQDIIRDADILPLYRKAGVMHMYVGVEAADQETLDYFQKNTEAQQGREALRLLNEAGIVTETSFILGLPEETPESIARTLELAKAYDPDFAHFLLLAPWPYADLWPELKDFVATGDYSKYNLVEPVIKPKTMKTQELFDATLDCYRSFYMNKLPIWDRLDDSFKRDYVFKSIQAIVKHSFLKDHHKGLGSMPKEVEKYLGLGG